MNNTTGTLPIWLKTFSGSGVAFKHDPKIGFINAIYQKTPPLFSFPDDLSVVELQEMLKRCKVKKALKLTLMDLDKMEVDIYCDCSREGDLMLVVNYICDRKTS